MCLCVDGWIAGCLLQVTWSCFVFCRWLNDEFIERELLVSEDNDGN